GSACRGCPAAWPATAWRSRRGTAAGRWTAPSPPSWPHGRGGCARTGTRASGRWRTAAHALSACGPAHTSFRCSASRRRRPRPSAEAGGDEKHYSEKTYVPVRKQKVRVLLFASGPTREFQYVRNLLAREAKKEEMELSIYLQQYRDDSAKRLLAMQQDNLGKRF